MRTILLPFYDDDVSQHAFELCARLVRSTEGYLEGLFVLRRPQILSGDGDMLADTHLKQLEEECRRIADRARERFETCVASQDLPSAAVAASTGPSVAWREIEGVDEQVIGSHGRLFDLVVLGRDFGGSWLDWRALLEAALFESGRPVLLTPHTPAATFGENVIIAWNSSTETARTVALARPLLDRAQSVTVLAIDGWGVPGPGAREFAAYLTRAGIPTQVRTVTRNGRSPGETILAECAKSGADLLIKGAYTQSRLRQLIFGGATRHILANAELPVVLAN
jgi:nucleotide-binding universal stress UspA family protein